MRAAPFALTVLVISIAATAPISGANSVPFKGSWSGVTVSADLATFPVVQIVADGDGQLTHLGRYFMTSPHTTDVTTGETIGDQIFTAANGDTLTAFCAGFALPDATGIVTGGLDCNITGGTGRFEDATGTYVFFIHASPDPNGPGFVTEATIDGEISF